MRPIDANPTDLKTVRKILDAHVPKIEVRAFGSRVSWTARETSDLDLALMTDEPLDTLQMALLREAFTNSDLPFRVDIVDWATTSSRFRKVIERDYVVLRASSKSPDKVSGWQHTTLGAVIDLLSGGTPSKSKTEYWDGTIPWVSAKDMKRFRLRDTRDHLTTEGATNGTKVVPADTVLMLTRGMTLLNDLPICVIEQAMAFNQDVKALRLKDGVLVDFLPYLMLGNKTSLLSLVDLAGHGTGRLNSEELKALDIQLPPLPEQRAIAHVLGTLDDKIDLNRRMNETLEAMARAIFKDWFVDFGPVRAKMEGRTPYLAPEVWNLFPDALDDEGKPAGWETKPLDKIAEFLNGLALQKFPASSLDESLAVIKIAELRSGITPKSNKASREIPEKYIVKDGDFLFSWSGSLLAKFWTGGEGALNQHLFKVTSDRYPAWFFSQWIYHHLAEFRAIAAAKATTMGHIQRTHLKAAMATCPPDYAFPILSDTISPLVEHAIKSELESRSLAQIRDMFLQKLMSGEIRIQEMDQRVTLLA